MYLKNQKIFKFFPTSCKYSVDNTINFIKDFIDTNNCKELEVNIRNLSAFDANRTIVFCSTHHFNKYIDGKIKWYVKDSFTIKLTLPFRLSNIEMVLNQNSDNNITSFNKSLYQTQIN